MTMIAKGTRQILLGHICSKCNAPLVQKLTLYAEGRANAFFHEREMAEEARENAFRQAMKDIVACYETPRQLGSYTDVPTGNNRTGSYYRLNGLDDKCPTCGNVEPWQLGKKSVWNPMDDPFHTRAIIPNVAVHNRPVLLASELEMAQWLANPFNQQNLENLVADGKVSAKETEPVGEDQLWTCFKCKTVNKKRVMVCQGCGVTKQWSDVQTEKQAKKQKK